MKNLLLPSFILLSLSACVESSHQLLTKKQLESFNEKDSLALIERTNSLIDIKSGTTDGGGGNAIDDGKNIRMLESFIIDPKKEYAFKKYIYPLFKSIKLLTEKNQGNDDTLDFMTRAFYLKTWYKIPHPLEKVDKKVLGFEAVQTEMLQPAYQTRNEIFIDQKLYDSKKMRRVHENATEQARVLMHEYFMSLYLLQFLDYPSLKNQLARIVGNDFTVTEEHWNLFYRTDRKLPLNDSDYSNIRNATNAFFLSKGKWDDEGFLNNLRAHHFGSLFEKEEDDYSHTDEEIIPQNYSPSTAFHSAQKSLLQGIFGSTVSNTADFKAQWNSTIQLYQKQQEFQLQIQTPSAVQIYSFTAPSKEESLRYPYYQNTPPYTELYLREYGQLSSTTFYPSRSIQRKVGEIVHRLTIYHQTNEQSIGQSIGITLTPYIITEIVNNGICEAMEMKATSFETGITISGLPSFTQEIKKKYHLDIDNLSDSTLLFECK